MQPQLQRIEIESARRHDYDFAVDDAALREPLDQSFVKVGEIAVEWP